MSLHLPPTASNIPEWIRKAASAINSLLTRLTTAEVEIDALGNDVDGLDAVKLEWATPPVNATDPGTPGQIAYDGSFFYLCVATDTWVRTPLATWP